MRKKSKEPRLRLKEVHSGTLSITNALPHEVYFRLLREYAIPWGYNSDFVNMYFVYYHIQNNKELYLHYVTNERKRNIILKEIQDAEEKKKRKPWYSPFLRKKRNE